MSGGSEHGPGGWLKHSFIDYPGTVSTVLFFRGCNLRCPYCHNPSIVRGSTPPVDFNEVCAYLDRRKGIIEGVVLTGGEPTLHGTALLDIVNDLRAMGLKIKLDTNGLLPDMITAVSPDFLALDLKTAPHRYGELGYGKTDAAEALDRSLAMAKEMGSRAEVRITVAAPFVGEQEISTFETLLAGVHAVFLQPFKAGGELLDPGFAEKGPVSMETIRRYRDRIVRVVGWCIIRGES